MPPDPEREATGSEDKNLKKMHTNLKKEGRKGKEDKQPTDKTSKQKKKEKKAGKTG